MAKSKHAKQQTADERLISELRTIEKRFAAESEKKRRTTTNWKTAYQSGETPWSY